MTLSNHTKRKLVSGLISASLPLILVRTCQRVSQSFHFSSRRLLSARSTRQNERKTINKLSLSYRCWFRGSVGENKKRSVSPSPPMIYDPINKIKFRFLRPAAATAEKETARRLFLGLHTLLPNNFERNVVYHASRRCWNAYFSIFHPSGMLYDSQTQGKLVLLCHFLIISSIRLPLPSPALKNMRNNIFC